MKEDFTDEDGIRAGVLEAEFAEMNGWDAESDAAILLNGLGIDKELHEKYMRELTGGEKVKVLFDLNDVTLYGDLNAPMVKAAISTGSGEDMVPKAIATDCDVIITGDIGYHCALDAIAAGLCIIDAGHFGLEKIFIPYMKTYLERKAEGVEAVSSNQKEIGFHL